MAKPTAPTRYQTAYLDLKLAQDTTAEALIHAADFNQVELDKRLNFLAELLLVMTEDGDVTGARAICGGIIFLWGEADLNDPCPQVPKFFAKLRARLASP